MWSVISGLVVLQSTIRETLKSSLLRTIEDSLGIAEHLGGAAAHGSAA